MTVQSQALDDIRATVNAILNEGMNYANEDDLNRAFDPA